MVARRAKGKKQRGIQPCVEKHRIKSKTDSVNIDPTHNKLCGIRITQITRLAEICFNYICRLSCYLGVIPMDHRNGQLVITSSRKRRIIHNGGTTVTFAIFVLRMMIVIPVLHKHGLTVETLMTIVMLMPSVGAATIGAANFFKCTETLEVVNSWKYTLECLQKTSGRPLCGLEDLPVSLKVIGATWCSVIFAMAVSVLPFVYPDLPLSMRNVFLIFGIQNFVNTVVLHIICVPLDVLLVLLPSVSTTLATSVLIIGIGVLKLYYVTIRYRYLYHKPKETSCSKTFQRLFKFQESTSNLHG